MKFGNKALYFGVEVTVLRFRLDALNRFEVRFPGGGIEYAFPDDLKPVEQHALPTS